jgi:hypothetical protein
MAEHQLTPGTEILFTRQIHDAHRAGRHYDIRLVVGDKAYSWATRKDIPGVGKSIVLFEQPVHTAHYALSDNIVIPDGSYGAGTTKLDFVRKATIGEHSTQDQMTLHTKSGEKYLLKRLPDGKFGKNAWLFRNLGMTGNKYLEKISGLINFATPNFYHYGEDHYVSANRKLGYENGKHNPVSRAWKAVSTPARQSKFVSSLKGIHHTNLRHDSLVDEIGRKSFSGADYRFSKKDFTEKGKNLLNERFKKSLDLHMEQLRDAGHVDSTTLDQLKESHTKAFQNAYKSTSHARTAVKTGGALVGSALLGVAAYGANKYLKKARNNE